MIAYIKDAKTFATKHTSPAAGSLALRSALGEVSALQLADMGCATAGDLVFAGGFAGVVTEADAHKRALSCVGIESLFARALLPVTDDCAGGVEQFIQRQLETHFKSVEDVAFALPYLQVETRTQTPSALAPEVGADGTWNLRDFFYRAALLAHVHVEFSAARDGMQITLIRRDPQVHNVFLDTAGFRLIEDVKTPPGAAKATVQVEADGSVQEWYLMADGSITREPDGERAAGSWEVAGAATAEAAEQMARKLLLQNGGGRTLVFSTPREYAFMDRLHIRCTDGETLRSYVASVQTDDTGRFTYRTGEAALTLDEKLKTLRATAPVVVNSLASTSTTAPLAAAQGKILKELAMQGVPGPQGPKGDKGDTGEKGDKGDTGNGLDENNFLTAAGASIPYTLLFSGTWASASESITLDGLSKFRMLVVQMSGNGTGIPLWRQVNNGIYFRGEGAAAGLNGTAISITNYAMAFTVSGNTLTKAAYSRIRHNNATTHDSGSGTWPDIVYIWGVL